MKKTVIGIISSIAGAAIGTTVGAVTTSKIMEDKVNEWKSMSDKHLSLFLMMNQWVKVKQEEKSVVEYFVRNGYHKIAIYGMSYAGEALVEELEGSDIIVAYGIDRNADGIYANIEIVSGNEELQSVDAIVVTAITFFDDIKQKLCEKLDCPIISLEDILYEM